MVMRRLRRVTADVSLDATNWPTTQTEADETSPHMIRARGCMSADGAAGKVTRVAADAREEGKDDGQFAQCRNGNCACVSGGASRGRHGRR
jgi:hypothetical protein